MSKAKHEHLTPAMGCFPHERKGLLGLHPMERSPFDEYPRTRKQNQYELTMKKIFLLAGVVALLTTSGCLIAPGGGGRHGRDEGPPVVRVEGPRPPEVIVRP